MVCHIINHLHGVPLGRRSLENLMECQRVAHEVVRGVGREARDHDVAADAQVRDQRGVHGPAERAAAGGERRGSRRAAARRQPRGSREAAPSGDASSRRVRDAPGAAARCAAAKGAAAAERRAELQATGRNEVTESKALYKTV